MTSSMRCSASELQRIICWYKGHKSTGLMLWWMCDRCQFDISSVDYLTIKDYPNKDEKLTITKSLRVRRWMKNGKKGYLR